MYEKVRCKFYVSSITRSGYCADGKAKTSQLVVTLNAVYAPKDDKSENHKFWESSPSGKMELTINNPACFDFFKEGEEMYLDMVKANP